MWEDTTLAECDSMGVPASIADIAVSDSEDTISGSEEGGGGSDSTDEDKEEGGGPENTIGGGEEGGARGGPDSTYEGGGSPDEKDGVSSLNCQLESLKIDDHSESSVHSPSESSIDVLSSASRLPPAHSLEHPESSVGVPSPATPPSAESTHSSEHPEFSGGADSAMCSKDRADSTSRLEESADSSTLCVEVGDEVTVSSSLKEILSIESAHEANVVYRDEPISSLSGNPGDSGKDRTKTDDEEDDPPLDSVSVFSGASVASSYLHGEQGQADIRRLVRQTLSKKQKAQRRCCRSKKEMNRVAAGGQRREKKTDHKMKIKESLDVGFF